MENTEIRITTLPPMRVASALGFGKEPEGIAWEKLMAFVKEKNLMDTTTPPRFFGFNNPDPSAGSPNYGYEQWVTVGPGIQAAGEIKIHDYSGGLYAVLRCEGIPNPDIWRKLLIWLEKSGYKMGNHQWLEELLSPPDAGMWVFDLYLPITK